MVAWYVVFSAHIAIQANSLILQVLKAHLLSALFHRFHVVRGGTGMTRWSHSRLDRARQQREREPWHEDDSIHTAVN